MELDAFTQALGIRQGRVRRAGEDAAHVLVLGDVEARRAHNLTAGDYIEWSQQVDLGPADIVRLRGSMTVPNDVPPGLAWELSIVIAGRKASSLVAVPGRAQRLDDMAAFAGNDAGRRVVAIRLELVSADG
jgi:hypothetical protein